MEKDLGAAQGDHCQVKNWEKNRERQEGRPDNMWKGHWRGKGGGDSFITKRTYLGDQTSRTAPLLSKPSF